MISGTALFELTGAFFLIAALYASVGFGGGSSYLAILSLYLNDFLAVKTTGLLCNLVVAGGGSILSGQKGHIDWKRFLPIIGSGVLMAFIGGTVELKQHSFFICLGAVLLLSGLLLAAQMIARRPVPQGDRAVNPLINIALGAAIGFLSGLVGIGGGILLSPVLNLMRWSNPRKIAALASLFILINSIAVLCGQLYAGHFRLAMPLALILLVAVFVGGQLGSRLSLRVIRPQFVRGLTGVLVSYIGLKLVLKYTAGITI
jgi:uncharacterized membrane protein YfcA